MKGWRPPLQPDSPESIRFAITALSLIALLAGGFWVIGRTDRVFVYGTSPWMDNMALLKVDNPKRYAMPREATYRLEPGCRYDLNYPPIMGGRWSRPDNPVYKVRRATLVDC